MGDLADSLIQADTVNQWMTAMHATKPWFRFAPLWECLIEIIVCLTLSCSLLILIFVFLRKMAYVCLLQISDFLCQSPRYSAIKWWPQSLAVTRFRIAGGWVKRHYITVASWRKELQSLLNLGERRGTGARPSFPLLGSVSISLREAPLWPVHKEF